MNLQPILNSPKNRFHVFHARIPRSRQRGELLKTHGGVHQVAQNQLGRFGLTLNSYP